MSEDTRPTIDASIDETTWTPLAMHAKRSALFLVDASIGLSVAGNAIAHDRQAIVAHWIATGLLRRPTEEERAAWNEDDEAHRFRFVIVQPYVLAERLPPRDAN